MAKRTCSHKSITPTATADTTNLVDATYPWAIQGGSGTQRTRVSEIYMGGQAAVTSPTIMVFGRHSTIGVTLSKGANLLDAWNDPASADLAAPPVVFNTATTKPQRSATLGALLNLSFNAFGGLVRWVAPPDGEISMVGNTASLGELGLSAFTGGTTGLLGGHMVYETF